MFDAHIHLDQYNTEEQAVLFRDLAVDGMIAVSMNLPSCRKTQQLAAQYPGIVYPAYGFHPEQPLPENVKPLFDFIELHHAEMIAIGEVGLPYYTRQLNDRQSKMLDTEPYIDLLDKFIQLAVKLDKPIVLHAVFEDAAMACDLLEVHNWNKAHFHWYKGDPQTTERMMRNGYFISVTPDIYYKEDTQQLVKQYALEQLMVETDGPWTFKGPFAGQMTHPNMVALVVEKIAQIRGLSVDQVKEQMVTNTRLFYSIPSSAPRSS